MRAEHVVTALSALAQEHRLRAFRFLVQQGSNGAAAGLISEHLAIAPSSLSFHLSHLTRAGLIRQRRQSRSLIYTADYAAMTGLLGYLTENCCGGAACDADAACEAQERNAA